MTNVSNTLYCLFLILLFTNNQAYAQSEQNDYWEFSTVSENVENHSSKELPKAYRIVNLSLENLKSHFEKVPTILSKTETGFLVELPTPDGGFRAFEIFENSVIAPEVAHLYTVKTYKGFDKENPSIQIRCSMSDLGFNAFIYEGEKSFTIEPQSNTQNESHLIYYKNQLEVEKLKCGFEHTEDDDLNLGTVGSRTVIPALRTFRLAYTSSGEFSQQWGGSPYSTTNVLNTIATGLNMVNPIFERDLGVTFTLVTNDNLIWPDPATDPFDLSNQFTLVVQNHTECVNELGVGGFDVGHLLVWANTGGLAYTAACNSTYKGRAFSGSNFSLSHIFIDYSAHELGHQFGASHNFASQECGTSVSGFRFEPGEGSSIMSYAGVCGAPASYQNFSDPFFHCKSIGSMQNFISTSATCSTTSLPGSGNASEPVSDAKSDITVPKETPFILVGNGSDGNDPLSQLTYSWEQWDNASVAVSGAPDCASTSDPLFKFEDPVNEKFKSFPNLSSILKGNNSLTWEKLPCTARTMNFNFAVRDNNPNWGRIGQSQMQVTVADTGPFAVITPNGGENWTTSTNTVTWSENGTSAHCPTVDILFSTDSGDTYNILALGVANDGSQNVSFSGTVTNHARILVQCSVTGNFRSASTFYDVTNDDFTINAPVAPSAPLPVELIYFDGKVTNDGNLLSWATASETNNKGFFLEKSLDGISFTEVAFLDGKGNSFETNNYSYLDKNLSQKTNYYRLNQIDFDGENELSNVVSISNEKTDLDLLTIFPNPVKNNLINLHYAFGDNEILDYELIDITGKEVKAGSLDAQESQISLPSINGGIYFLSIKNSRGILQTHKVIVQ